MTILLLIPPDMPSAEVEANATIQQSNALWRESFEGRKFIEHRRAALLGHARRKK
jgi:hypothetical protein